MSKRETQVILKTEERNQLLEVGRDGKFVAKTIGWDEDQYSLKGTSSKSQSRTAAGCSIACPQARDRRPNCSDTIFRSTETALHRW
jgi:hypothetical protein